MKLSSLTEHSFHGITPSPTNGKNVIHVPAWASGRCARPEFSTKDDTPRKGQSFSGRLANNQGGVDASVVGKQKAERIVISAQEITSRVKQHE